MTADGWRPIDTAPLDGTRVLLWSPRGRHKWSRPGEAWLSRFFVFDKEWCGRRIKTAPTHWMPLPDGPAEPETT